ncbi:hypothetical protein [uncultured Gammaproteobacteria bacterium]|nr:hypothetical protein [uncultured Gammaproteobacteria bacterium]
MFVFAQKSKKSSHPSQHSQTSREGFLTLPNNKTKQVEKSF